MAGKSLIKNNIQKHQSMVVRLNDIVGVLGKQFDQLWLLCRSPELSLILDAYIVIKHVKSDYLKVSDR